MADGRELKNLSVPLGASMSTIRRLAAEAIGLRTEAIAEVRVVKRSLDARRRRKPHEVLTVKIWETGETVPADRAPQARVGKMKPLRAGQAPIVVGMGPAGLWAALRFIEAGEPCILIDRGGRLEERHAAVRGLRRNGQLDAENNLCFGEGGAGTYTDGKLYTRKRDPGIRRVYEDFVAFGAQPEILTDAHPHIGTNRLIQVVGVMRKFLEEKGCLLRFDSRVDGLVRNQKGTICGVRLSDGEEITGPAVLLATGHSARDTYEWLHAMGVPMEPKPFAIGVRAEHPQELINSIQYGDYADDPALEAAAYALTGKMGNRGIYSFCMCPGGFIVPTPTETKHLNVNGMSNSGRGSKYANAALVVTVTPDDYWIESPGDLDHLGPMKGVGLQRHFEQAAFVAGGENYHAPAQRLTDFLEGKVGDVPDKFSYRPGIKAVDLGSLMPQRIGDPLARSILHFEKKMPGYLTREAILLGFETTTSSPVRMLRDNETLMSPGFPGLYPCGEGAGWAGGIVSSALEGIRCAESALSAMSAD